MKKIKVLPNEGKVTVQELAQFFGVPNEKMKRALQEKGIRTIDLSATHTKLKLVDLADFK